MEWSRRRRDDRRRTFIQSYAFPPSLRAKLSEEFESEYQVDVALEGLREWYLACLSARGETLGMPSRAVDVAWHEMILMTRTYHWFCERAFGHYLHHAPEAMMDEPIDDSLARTLQLLEAQAPAAAIAGVPLLFAVDGQLGRADGYTWQTDQLDQLRRRELDSPAHHPGSAAFDGGTGGKSCGGGGGCGGGGCGGGG
jgi:hypothetical protein